MRLTTEAIMRLIDNAYLLEERTVQSNSHLHDHVEVFDACMIAFGGSIPAKTVRFSVLLADPVNKEGYVEFGRDGSMRLMTKDIADVVDEYNRGHKSLEEVKEVLVWS